MKKIHLLTILPLLWFALSCSDESSDPVAVPAEAVFSEVFKEGVWPTSDYSGTESAILIEGLPDLNQSDGSQLIAQVTAVNNVQRSLLKFKIQGLLPTNITIKRAVLTLSVSGFSESQAVDIHEMQTDWQKDRVTWNTSGVASWVGGDFSPTVMASSPCCSLLEIVTSVDIEPELVLKWLESDFNNHGLLIKGQDEDKTSALEVFTGQTGSVNQRPFLTIYYTI